MEQKIKVRLLGMALFSMALTMALSLFIFFSVMGRQTEADMARTADLVAQSYTALSEYGSSGMPQALAGYATDGLRITLIDAAGQVIFESDGDAALMENHLSRPEVAQALATGRGQSSRASGTLGAKTYYHALALGSGQVLRIARQAENVYSMYTSAVPILCVIVLLLMAISAMAAAFLTRQLLRPLAEMAPGVADMTYQAPYKELEPFVHAIQAQQAEKQAAERMRQEFTANVSHELKTPLTSISGYAEMIETGMVQAQDIQGFAGKIRFEAGRLIRLIGDIIELGRLDEPGAGKNFTLTDLRELAQSTVQYLDLAAAKAEVTLEIRGPALVVDGDKGMLEELVYNLCDNAIRYNRPGGKVILETSDGAAPCLTVIDTGIGIPEAHQARVFERFYRVDKSRSRESGGTGLGLAIVKHIAMQHGAEISLRSAEGQGTAITVCFKPTRQLIIQ